MLNRDLLWLACRHHVYEIPIKAIFDKVVESTSCPEVKVFKRFQINWDSLDKLNFDSGISDYVILAAVEPVKNDILSFAKAQLKVKKL